MQQELLNLNKKVENLNKNINDINSFNDSLKSESTIPHDVDLAFRARLLPTYSILSTGLFTTASGSATQTITVVGATVNDIPIVSINTVGLTPRTITSVKISSSNTLTFVMSGDPSSDHIINYVVFRIN